jgi:alanine-glyoxylate transaminase/serine-glyoxylate transaminase/serine-pyruvate transaminase
MAVRCGAEVALVKADWGRIIEPEQVEEALRANPGAKVVTIVHGETSTGILQPLEEISQIAHRAGALLLVDAVTSLTGCELRLDEWGIDVCFSGTQKCLSAPPGLSPVSFSPQAMDVVAARREPARSWYVDVSLLRKYWGGGQARVYHHTPPMTMLYALREALRIALEEGLEARIARHHRNAEALWAGLEAIGLTLHAQEGYRLPPLTTVRVPEGIDEMDVRRGLLQEHNIEVGGGIGELQGQIWRIGLMGFGSSPENVLALLYALETQLTRLGYRLEKGASVAAAVRSLNADL